MKIKLRNALVLTETGRERVDIFIEDGRIAGLGHKNSPVDKEFDLSGLTILPGFIDVHLHGAGGKDTMEGTYEALNTIAVTHAKHGTTAMVPASVAATMDELLRVATAIKEVVAKGTSGAKILGWHAEGPYMNLECLGAHRKECVRSASIKEIEELWEASGKNIRLLTLAPEIEGALELIEYLRTLGVVPTMGHTSATVLEFDKAVEKGALHTTHLFNAMRKFHHREPGIIGAALSDDRVSSEVIADGIHVHPVALKLFAKCKGPDKAVLVTDSIEAVDLPEGEYSLGNLKVFVKDGSARLEDGTLAGSTLTMEKAIINMIEFAGISLEEASQMASLNPARLLGIDYKKGSIKVGKDADLVVLDADFNVKLTVVEGNIVYDNLG